MLILAFLELFPLLIAVTHTLSFWPFQGLMFLCSLLGYGLPHHSWPYPQFLPLSPVQHSQGPWRLLLSKCWYLWSYIFKTDFSLGNWNYFPAAHWIFLPRFPISTKTYHIENGVLPFLLLTDSFKSFLSPPVFSVSVSDTHILKLEAQSTFFISFSPSSFSRSKPLPWGSQIHLLLSLPSPSSVRPHPWSHGV